MCYVSIFKALFYACSNKIFFSGFSLGIKQQWQALKTGAITAGMIADNSKFFVYKRYNLKTTNHCRLTKYNFAGIFANYA